MIRLKWISLLATGLVLQTCLITQGQSLRRGTSRDLAAYDKVGPYTVCNEIPPEEGDKKIAEIRSFLWQHWKEQRLGLVTATFCSIEGDEASTTFFVEPGAKGHWRIKVYSTSTIYVLLAKQKRRARRKTTHVEYDEVQRVKTTGKGQPTWEAIPENDLRQQLTYELRLKNSVTNSVQIF